MRKKSEMRKKGGRNEEKRGDEDNQKG